MKRILFDSYNKVQNPYGKFLDMVLRRSCNRVWSSAAPTPTTKRGRWLQISAVPW